MNKYLNAILTLLFSVFVSSSLFAGGTVRTNPPSECSAPNTKCNCPQEGVSANCIKVNIGLGETTPWTGSLGCSLKIFADDDSPSIFTPESLHAVLGGYTFKRLGQKTMSDGVTPAEVVLSHPNGEAVHFVFANGESLGRPDPGVHIKMDARLQMVDAEGWATTHDPVYYDLYVGDGTKRRFLATNMTGALGALVSITDERGVVRTPADMGVDIIYDPDGVRQYLTPSRLANVTRTADFLGYDVAVYALQEPPQKDAATGLYIVPEGQTVEHVSVRRENGGKRAVVTIRKGGGDPLRYVFDYAMGDWSLTRSSGVEEVKSRNIYDSRAAQTVTEVLSSSRTMLGRTECNYKWMSWGFAMTNKVEGFDGVTDTTTWTYYTSGNGKGQVKTEQHQSGLLIQYAYDNLDRVTSETRSGPDMMTEVTTYDYSPVDPSDPVLPVDTRPRTIVRKLNNIECERTYYVYSPLTNIVERVGTQGAPYGGTNALRTVKTFYPTTVGADFQAARSGLVASIRHEDGKTDLYDYSLVSNLWIRTVTHLHEQSPLPVSGKTTRDITITNARGEQIENRTKAYIDGIWYTIARNQMTYNSEGKRTSVENLAGQVTTTAWDCCHKVSEVQPDGSTTTWDYDDEGRMIASSRLIPLDMTNVTWLTTCYRYDALDRQTATWQTNYAAQVGLPVTRTRYDQLGRVIARVDQLGNTTTTEYSPDGRTVFVRNPNTSTRVTTRSASGDTLSITGTAVTPEFHTYGISPDGTRWSRAVQGETASSPRFTKRYENILGQTIREERSGFRGAVLATVNTYDSYGRLVSTSADYEPIQHFIYDACGVRCAIIQMSDGKWRKNEIHNILAQRGATTYLVQTNLISCSDSAIKPFKTCSFRQLNDLSTHCSEHSYFEDIRENVVERQLYVRGDNVVLSQAYANTTNKSISIARYRVPVMDVSVSYITNAIHYDCLGRQIAITDGRGNITQTEYNTIGQQLAKIDALGNRTTYSYDRCGNLISLTDPLGHTTVYEYDLQGRKTYEGGATYPVRYTYDIFGNKTTIMTYRDESLGPNSGDVTTWFYDESSGLMTHKVYANGKGPTYSYTPDGRVSQRIWARGIETTYSYDSWGALVRTDYSDNTPSVVLSYDAMGNQICVIDAAGVTTFAYDIFGSLTNETTICIAGTNTIERFYDPFGRDGGYALNGVRQSILAYDPGTGRLLTMQVTDSSTQTFKHFTWSYLPGADLKSSLSYPNGLTASWAYDANNHVLQVSNATPTSVISQYDYNYDAAGRRINMSRSGVAFDKCDMIVYGYNDRSELTNVTAAADASYRFVYQFDDIGNREMATEHGANSVYTANRLNQYSVIDGFKPEYDDDGNQTLIKTTTGVWSVVYDGENRPVSWINSSTNIIMVYERKGRRVEYLENTCEISGLVATNAHYRFIYDGFRCVKRLNASLNNVIDCAFIWDPSAQVATRPLMIEKPGMCSFFVTHDGFNNVSELVPTGGELGHISHYEYAPFGSVTVFCDDGSNLISQFANSNPFRFSSEYYDERLGLICYTYRHYNHHDGRWCSRDPLEERSGVALYAFLNNRNDMLDVLGLTGVCCKDFVEKVKKGGGNGTSDDEMLYKLLLLQWGIAKIGNDNLCDIDVECETCQDDKSRSGHSSFEGGYAQYYEKFDWRHPLRGFEPAIHVRICTDDSGKTFGDLRHTAAILNHELIHAKDHCRKQKGFECGEFSLAALNAGRFDDKICTEIHAHAQMNKGMGLAPLEKEDVISGAVNSVLQGCEISKAKPDSVDDNFSEELKKRVAQMYDQCKDWEAR